MEYVVWVYSKGRWRQRGDRFVSGVRAFEYAHKLRLRHALVEVQTLRVQRVSLRRV